MHVYSLTFAYLQALFSICMVNVHLMDSRYFIDTLEGLIIGINNDYAFRTLLHQTYLATFSNENSFKMPPGLMEQQHMSSVLNILHYGAVRQGKDNFKK